MQLFLHMLQSIKNKNTVTIFLNILISTQVFEGQKGPTESVMSKDSDWKRGQKIAENHQNLARVPFGDRPTRMWPGSVVTMTVEAKP